MTVQELIDQLQNNNFDPKAEVMILDGHNGGGHPRTLNLGPVYRMVDTFDSDETADCEGLEYTNVVLLGYGCY